LYAPSLLHVKVWVHFVDRQSFELLRERRNEVLERGVSTVSRTDVAIAQLTMLHSGNNVSSTIRTSGPYEGSFTGTLRDPSSIASTTDTAGTMTVPFSFFGEESDDLHRHGQVHEDCQLDARGDDRAANHARMRDYVDGRYRFCRTPAVGLWHWSAFSQSNDHHRDRQCCARSSTRH
jgi:hypothetical protein